MLHYGRNSALIKQGAEAKASAFLCIWEEIMAGYKRVDRLNEEVQREVDQIIRNELNDPRISGMWSITRVEVTGDLRYAKVYISTLEDAHRKELLSALKGAAGMIRRELGRRMQIRYVPELLLINDENIAYGVHIASVLASVAKGEEKDADTDTQS